MTRAQIPLIGTGNLTRESLAGQVGVVTGGGGGIGYEAARALLWLGARVVIAEIDKRKGKHAAARLVQEWGADAALVVHTDVGDERSVERLKRVALRRYGQVDVVLNNATVAPLGAVKDVSIGDWDISYRVNLRGPVLLARALLPDMLARDAGVFACVSSLGTAYMGAYEAIKAAQVHLAATLDAELEGTGVSAFTIGPGFVPTETALSSIPRLAAMMGMPVDELRAMVQVNTVSIEAAGAGFAAAIVMAERYRGQEISSVQALLEAGIEFSRERRESEEITLATEQLGDILALCRKVRATLREQSAGWRDRNVFEQQWLIRTFKNYARMPAEEWRVILERMERCAEAQDAAGLLAVDAPLDSLAGYYGHLYDMAKGYVKDPVQREEQLRVVRSWQEDAERLGALLKGG